MGRPEERLGPGEAPVEQQLTAVAVRQAEPADVQGLGVVRVDDAAQRQVQAEAAQGAQSGGQAVDLQVAVECLLADAAGRLALGVEAFGELGDRVREALGDGGEVLLVGGDQGRIGLGGEVVREGESAAGQGLTPISGRSTAPSVRVDRGLAASPPVSYTLKWEGRGLPSSLVSSPRPTRGPSSVDAAPGRA